MVSSSGRINSQYAPSIKPKGSAEPMVSSTDKTIAKLVYSGVKRSFLKGHQAGAQVIGRTVISLQLVKTKGGDVLKVQRIAKSKFKNSKVEYYQASTGYQVDPSGLIVGQSKFNLQTPYTEVSASLRNPTNFTSIDTTKCLIHEQLKAKLAEQGVNVPDFDESAFQFSPHADLSKINLTYSFEDTKVVYELDCNDLNATITNDTENATFSLPERYTITRTPPPNIQLLDALKNSTNTNLAVRRKFKRLVYDNVKNKFAKAGVKISSVGECIFTFKKIEGEPRKIKLIIKKKEDGDPPYLELELDALKVVECLSQNSRTSLKEESVDSLLTSFHPTPLNIQAMRNLRKRGATKEVKAVRSKFRKLVYEKIKEKSLKVGVEISPKDSFTWKAIKEEPSKIKLIIQKEGGIAPSLEVELDALEVKNFLSQDSPDSLEIESFDSLQILYKPMIEELNTRIEELQKSAYTGESPIISDRNLQNFAGLLTSNPNTYGSISVTVVVSELLQYFSDADEEFVTVSNQIDQIKSNLDISVAYIRKELNANQSVAFRLNSKTHAVIAEIVPNKDGTRSLKIYNTGDGIRFHQSKKTAHSKKYQTMIEFKEKGSFKLAHHLGKLLSIKTEKNISALYDWANANLTPVENPDAPFLSKQKARNCTCKCVMTYLRHKLPPDKYNLFRAVLLLNTKNKVMQLEDRLFSNPQEGSAPSDSAVIEEQYPKPERKRIINKLTRMYEKRLMRLKPDDHLA